MKAHQALPDSARKARDDSIVYFTDHSDQLALRLYFLSKLNSMEVKKDRKSFQLRPNGVTSIGAGFNYRGLGLGLGLGLPKSTTSIDRKGSTKRLDIQLGIFSKRVGGDAFLQIYKGYYNANPEDFITWNKEYYPLLPEMSTVSFGVNAFYFFNNRRFSYKSTFTRTQVQRKSAGSFALGLFATYDEVSSSQGFIPLELKDSIYNDFDLSSFKYLAFGISVGYSYNFVISRSFFINLSLVPGFGFKQLEIKTLSGITSSDGLPHVQVLFRLALAYEHREFYAGLSGGTLLRNNNYNDYEMNLSTEQFRFYIGRRFNVGRKKPVSSSKERSGGK